MKKNIALLSFAILFVFFFAELTEAVVRVRRLGDPQTAFFSPDIKTQDDLRNMLQVRREDIRQVLTQAGWRGNPDDLLAALDRGEFSETTITPGTRMPFMAARKRGRAHAMIDVLYEGRPFEAYYVDFESAGSGWRFIAPKICSNFWIEERELPPPPPPPEAPPPPPPPAPEVPPPPPPEVEAPPPAPIEVEEGPGLFFLAGFLGKERRVDFEDELFERAECETIVGVKAGVLPRVAENVDLELSIGGKFVINDDEDDDDDLFDDDDDEFEDDDSDHTLFIDAAVQRAFEHGFIGGGLSFWDLNDEDKRTVALLVQLGLGVEKLQFMFEARAPFEDMDDLGNNYMFWGGIRIRP